MADTVSYVKMASYECEKCIVSVGRSGSKWMEKVCKDLAYPDQIQPCGYRCACRTSGSDLLTSDR